MARPRQGKQRKSERATIRLEPRFWRVLIKEFGGIQKAFDTFLREFLDRRKNGEKTR